MSFCDYTEEELHKLRELARLLGIATDKLNEARRIAWQLCVLQGRELPFFKVETACEVALQTLRPYKDRMDDFVDDQDE